MVTVIPGSPWDPLINRKWCYHPHDTTEMVGTLEITSLYSQLLEVPQGCLCYTNVIQSFCWSRVGTLLHCIVLYCIAGHDCIVQVDITDPSSQAYEDSFRSITSPPTVARGILQKIRTFIFTHRGFPIHRTQAELQILLVKLMRTVSGALPHHRQLPEVSCRTNQCMKNR